MRRPSRFVPLLATAVMVFCYFSGPAPAEAKDWKWSKYGFRMWLPNSMKPTSSNSSYFIAKGHGIVLKVAPWRSRMTTSKKAAMYGYNSYSIIQRKRILFQKRVKKWGSWRHTIIGEGIAEGRPAFFAVIGISSRRSNNNFYVRMWWRPRNHAWAKPMVQQIARRIYLLR
ncbi:MAG: hypothetical protein KC503_43375 [Myxococcales bacterium]|nr:hypothetical protein [Myxococcales bacterium]